MFFKQDLCNAKIQNIEDKVPDSTDLVTNTTLNSKINEVKNKIPSFNNLATSTTAFTAVEKNKYLTIVNISLLHNLKKLTAETFAARLSQVSLACKRDAANFVKSTDFDNKLKNLIKMLLHIKQSMSF